MKVGKIEFDPKLAHVLGFRHGPRAARPPAGNVWDYFRGLAPEAREIAQRTVDAYFPDLRPVALRCSQLPRSSQTLEYLWPDLVPQIKLDRRLGFQFEALKMWARIDKYANAYDMTPQEQHAIIPDLVDQCGGEFLLAAYELAAIIDRGQVAAMCSHVPYADAGARLARMKLGIFENDGWLPGSGFGSGAFVHLSFNHALQIVHCEYYPVPAE